MTENMCPCAWCRGISPWRQRFAQCIQEGWSNASAAISAGIACVAWKEAWEDEGE